jgi:DNA polymerase (family 10)
MDNKSVAKMFEELATLLELQGENPFKVNAYLSAAKTIEGLQEDIEFYYKRGELQNLKGIGKSIAEKIEELINTGKISILERLRSETPPGLIEMLKIPGLGPKKIKALYDKLKITSIQELEYACQENRLLVLEGFGQKTQEKIKHGISLLAQYKDKHLLSETLPLAKDILNYVKKCPSVEKAEIAGSLRRYKELVKDIDIIVGATDQKKTVEHCALYSGISEIIEKGENLLSFFSNGIRVDIKLVKVDEFISALMHFTGSKEHNVEIRRIAKQIGCKVNEYGIFKGEQKITVNSEEEFYKFFNMQYIPPELRENMGEVEMALGHKIPKLLEKEDLLGILHVHSDWSDGTPSIEDIAKEAARLGYKYIGIADHSKSAAYAGGLNEDKLKEQIKCIDELNEKLTDIRILKGIEVDIMKDGSIDLEDYILKELDFVIASVHSHFNMTEDEMTKRVLKALRHKYVNIIGHLSGRLLLGREPYKINIDTILEEAIKLNKVIELNANPYRLDIDWRYLVKYKDTDLMISINPDAHHFDGLNDMIYGIGIARKGWSTASKVLNTYKPDKIKLFFKS